MKACMLDAYLIQVRKVRTRKATGALEMGQFDGSTNLGDVLHQIGKKLGSYRKIDFLQRSFCIKNLKKSGDVITGILNVGEYGLACDVIDITDGTVKYSKKKHEIVPAPYFFMFVLPSKGKCGLLCLQRFGVNGVKGIMEWVFGGMFQKNFTDYTIDIMNVVPAELMREFVANGAVQEISVLKHEIPADIAQKFGGSHKRYEGIVEYTIRPRDKSLFKKSGLMTYVDGTKPLEQIFDFADFEYDTVKAKVDIGGRERIVDLTRPSRFNATFDVTDDVTEGKDGYPTVDSLEQVFFKMARSLGKRVGIVI